MNTSEKFNDVIMNAGDAIRPSEIDTDKALKVYDQGIAAKKYGDTFNTKFGAGWDVDQIKNLANRKK